MDVILKKLSILKTHDDILKLVYGVLLAEACLCGAEQGVRFSIILESIGDKACPQLV